MPIKLAGFLAQMLETPRQLALAAGALVYEGKVCRTCSTTTKSVSNRCCRACSKAYCHEHYRRPGVAQARAEYKRERDYGLNKDHFAARWLEQGGACAICSESLVVSKTGLAVDHCHAHGHVRGLLCRSCNLALGHLKDSPERARLAAAYLERTAAPKVD